VIQIGLGQHTAELDLSLGAKVQVAVLQRQAHGVDEPDVAEPDPSLRVPHHLGVAPEAGRQPNLTRSAFESIN
jgi:hypothetical protein